MRRQLEKVRYIGRDACIMRNDGQIYQASQLFFDVSALGADSQVQLRRRLVVRFGRAYEWKRLKVKLAKNRAIQ